MLIAYDDIKYYFSLREIRVIHMISHFQLLPSSIAAI